MADQQTPDSQKLTVTGDVFSNPFQRYVAGLHKTPFGLVILVLVVMLGGLFIYDQSLPRDSLSKRDSEVIVATGQKFRGDTQLQTGYSLIEATDITPTTQEIEPFVLEAEDYDEGGQGVAYYDKSKANEGGEYRDDSVDIEKSGDVEDGYNVGWIDSSEWLSYEFTTEESGSYDVSARVARKLWRGDFPVMFRLELDGVDITGEVIVSDTGGWHNWVTLETSTVFVDSGVHKLVFRALKNDNKTDLMNLNWIRFAPSDENDETITPIDPSPGGEEPPGSGEEATPIIIQSEDYGTGGEGVSYHDDDPENNGGQYRNDGVDIESRRVNGDGYSIGWVNGGEWLKYSFNAAGTGEYDVKIRVARLLWEGNVDTGFNLELDGQDISGTIGVPGTGGWGDWIIIDGPSLNIDKGQHELVFKVLDNGRRGVFNVDWIKFVPEGAELIEPEPIDDPPVIIPPIDDPPEDDPAPAPPPPPPVSGNGYDASKVGPTSSITCSGVDIYPGSSISSASSSYPAGTTFCIKAGTHYGQSVSPKSNQSFIGEVGAVLDGQNSKSHAFYSWSENSLNVTIKNLEIKNYNNSQYFGAINMFVGNPNWYSNPVYGSGGWTVKNCYIHHNNAAGIALGRDNVVVENNKLNYNGQEGISLRFGKNQKVINNEIAHNNPNFQYTWGNEAGGSKFWETQDMVLDSNYVHDNNGPGLWADHGNRDTVYSYNTIENNFSSGIFHEISYGAKIYGNTIKNNGHGWSDGWLWGAGIQIANAGLADIYDNYLENNNNGIAFTDQGRGYGPLSGTVHNNTIVSSDRTGVATNQGSFPSGPFSFYDNTYSGSNSWVYNGRFDMNQSSWRGYFPND